MATRACALLVIKSAAKLFFSLSRHLPAKSSPKNVNYDTVKGRERSENNNKVRKGSAFGVFVASSALVLTCTQPKDEKVLRILEPVKGAPITRRVEGTRMGSEMNGNLMK
jgi:hypothetical protein